MLQQIAELVGVVIWPTVLVFVVLLFRRSLRGLMERDNFSVKAPGGFELSASRRAEAAVALADATQTKDGQPVSASAALETVDDAARTVQRAGVAPRILWVDDVPSNNRYERNALAAIGIAVDLSTSTDDALERIHAGTTYDVIISDMARPPNRQAGYELLEKLRAEGNRTPYIIYAGSTSPDLFDEAVRRGAEGCTNRPQELIDMVLNVLRRSPSAQAASARTRSVTGRAS
jgi:CheY-like chemotaxis protein